MRLKQGGPRRLGRAVAGEYWNRMKGSTSRPGVNGTSPVSLDAGFVAQWVEAGQSTLCAGFIDPIGLNDAGVRAGLCGAHFADEWQSWLYRILCTSAEHGKFPSLADVERLAVLHGIDSEADRRMPMFRDWLDGLVFCTDALPRGLDMYAEAVRDYADRRTAVRDAWATLRHVLSVDALPLRRPAPTHLTREGRFPVRRLSA